MLTCGSGRVLADKSRALADTTRAASDQKLEVTLNGKYHGQRKPDYER